MLKVRGVEPLRLEAAILAHFVVIVSRRRTTTAPCSSSNCIQTGSFQPSKPLELGFPYLRILGGG